ncbi:hypothetical protein EG68_02512 [Paragonimus skrjabini miyazakii]|uniref:SREBP regulating gene protein n=1 Tax=Paragonimus skrjabini miyazakii TaxID=59628 RepID=A0A8S9YYS0_9TREM|nr:hypothetical protein EG68_02512 [Paragonimus skrjabini miyazakii]
MPSHRQLRALLLPLLFITLWCLVLFFNSSGRQTAHSTTSIEYQLPQWLTEWNISRQIKGCDYTAQSLDFVVDETGSYCSRSALLPSGCCPESTEFQPDVSVARRYVCDSCNSNLCCGIYEHCVSCCMDKQYIELWREVLMQAFQPSGSQRYLLLAQNLFEFCQSKCRTSSISVLHENSYQDADHRECAINWSFLVSDQASGFLINPLRCTLLRT